MKMAHEGNFLILLCHTSYSKTEWEITAPSTLMLYGFGTFKVLLVIKKPLTANNRTMGWNSKIEPVNVVPSGILSCIRPIPVQIAMIAELVRQANGTGVPSKYCDLPVLSFGSIETVTLNRASRVKLQRT